MQTPLAVNRLRKGSLYSFIVFLAISALLAIVSVLSGNFGDFEIKVLITTSVIAAASICSLCCSAYSSRVRSPAPSIIGIVLAGTSAAMLILGLWVEMSGDEYWKTTFVLSIYAIATAHVLALLAIRLRSSHAWLQKVAAINIFALSTIVSGLILGDDGNDDVFKLIVVLAILVALETLVIPILGRLAKETHPSIAKEVLSLTKRDDGTYEDDRGGLYEVKKVS